MTLSESHKKKRLNRVTSTTGADAIVKSEHLAARRILGIDELDDLPLDQPIHLLRGHYFEASICDLAQHLMREGTEYLDPMPGITLHKLPFRVHPDCEWLGTSVDRVAKVGDVSVGLVEAKSYLGARGDDFGTPGTDQVDERTFIQCVIHMAVLKQPWCRVPLDTGFDFKIYHIERDRELEDAVLSKLDEFWHKWIQPNVDRAIRDMELPKVDGLDATTEWIKRRYQEHTEQVEQPVPRHYEQALLHEKLTAQLKELKAKKDEISNLLRDEIGAMGGAGFRDDLVTITWKQTKGRKFVDWEQLAHHLGATHDLIEEFTKEGLGHRRLYVKLKKGAHERLLGGPMQQKLLQGEDSK